MCHVNGGEGNRTPDLLNAIQALSQLSYAPSSHFATLPDKITHPRGAASRVGPDLPTDATLTIYKAFGRNHQV